MVVIYHIIVITQKYRGGWVPCTFATSVCFCLVVQAANMAVFGLLETILIPHMLRGVVIRIFVLTKTIMILPQLSRRPVMMPRMVSFSVLLIFVVDLHQMLLKLCGTHPLVVWIERPAFSFSRVVLLLLQVSLHAFESFQ